MAFRGSDRGNQNLNLNLEAGVRRALIILVAAIVLLGLGTVLLSPHFYFFVKVNPDELAVRLSGGRIKDVTPGNLFRMAVGEHATIRQAYNSGRGPGRY